MGYVILILVIYIAFLVTLFALLHTIHENQTFQGCIQNCKCYYDVGKKDLTVSESWRDYNEREPLILKTKWYGDWEELNDIA